MPKKNKENLVSLADRTTDEQRKIASEGGKASGEARRRKKQLSEYLEIVLAKQPTGEITDALLEAGYEVEDVDNAMAMTLAILHKAQTGDTKAFEVIRDTIGQKPVEKISATVENKEVTGMINERVKRFQADRNSGG